MLLAGHCRHSDPGWTAPPIRPDMIFGKDNKITHSVAFAFGDRRLTLIKAALAPTPDTRTSIHFTRCRMSTFDMFYLGLVVAAFLVFAIVLAYYSHR
jgi:hypothetical protein